jgi:hypothetical protein
LIASLQGLAAKVSAEQIYIDEGGPVAVWKDYLSSKNGIALKDFSTWTSLLKHYKNLVHGYVLYNRSANARSLTAATSLCGPLRSIAVDASLEADVHAQGIITMKADVRSRDEKWVYEKYKSSFTKRIGAELDPALNQHLRDYITMTNAFTFYDGITSWRTSVLQDLEAEAFCMGYYALDEFNMVDNAAAQGVVMLPAEAPNLAPLSSVYSDEGLTQGTHSTPASEEKVHYVTFLTSDGDNIGFDLWTLQNYFSNSVRGTFNMGYTITPAMVDLAPSALRWYYEKASKGSNKDFFVAGPSGSGYTFPSKMPAADLDVYLNRLNTFLQKSDLNIVNILDQGAYQRMDVWNKYLSKPTIDGLLYTGYGESPQGRITFSTNGKPVIEARDNLWDGLEDEATVISNINSRPTDPHSVDGYTLVFVHVWTKNLSNVKTVINGLHANVRVVTPEEFVKLVKANVTTSSSTGSVATIENGATYKIINFNSGLSLDVNAISQDDGAAIIQWTYNGGNNQHWLVDSLTDGYYKITATHSSKALEIAGSSTTAGSGADQFSWSAGNNQMWKIEPAGDGTYKITNKLSGMVLQVSGSSTSNGAEVQQASWSNQSNQKWIIQTP